MQAASQQDNKANANLEAGACIAAVCLYIRTCVHLLPAHSEGGPGLDEVAVNGAAVVLAGAPGQLSRAVRYLLHCHCVRGPWRA